MSRDKSMEVPGSAKNEALNWIIQHLASSEEKKLNDDLLSSVINHDAKRCPLNDDTNQLLIIHKLRNTIESISFEDLHQHCLLDTQFLINFHKLYHPKLGNKKFIESIDNDRSQDLQSWTLELFKLETELKVQIVLSKKFWNSNYVEHKRLNDGILHKNHYDPETRSSIRRSTGFTAHTVPSAEVIQLLSKCANGLTFIHRTHQQLDFLGQRCTTSPATKCALDLNDTTNKDVIAIRQWFSKHSYRQFVASFLDIMDRAQLRVMGNGQSFLSRLSRTDPLQMINAQNPRSNDTMNRNQNAGNSQCSQSSQSLSVEIISSSPPSTRRLQETHSSSSSQKQQRPPLSSPKLAKYRLRTVVDVMIKEEWCPGTVIKRYYDGSIMVALHAEDCEDDGNYKYDTHLLVKNMSKVIHCINEDGEIEMDHNPKLMVDESILKSPQFSSPDKQDQIRKQRKRGNGNGVTVSRQNQSHHSHSNCSKPNRHRANRTMPTSMEIEHTDNSNNIETSNESDTTKSRQRHRPQPTFDHLLANRNRKSKQSEDGTVNRLGVDVSSMSIDGDVVDDGNKQNENEEVIPSQQSDISEPPLSNESRLLSPDTIKKTRIERSRQFRIRSISPTSPKATRSPNTNRRKRSFENVSGGDAVSNSALSMMNKTKRRKVSGGEEREQQQPPLQRRQSPRLLERKKKKMIQSKIASTEKKMITFSKDGSPRSYSSERKEDDDDGDNNDTLNQNGNQKNGTPDSGEVMEWEDNDDGEYDNLNKAVVQKKNGAGRKGKWTPEAEDALKRCYRKHEKLAKLVNNYKIWIQIDRDEEYSKYWPHRSTNALRDKARVLLGLGRKKRK